MSVSNEFEKEIIPLHTATIFRLFDIDPNAALLYLFLAKNAKIQGTNSVWCTNEFIRQGLKWGRDKVVRTKGMLEEEGFISQKMGRKEGKFDKPYLQIHYLPSGAPTQQPQDTRCPDSTPAVSTDSGFQDTNTRDKKINTRDKKESLFPSGNKVAKATDPIFLTEGMSEAYKLAPELNAFWKQTIGRGGHESLTSKFVTKNKYSADKRETQPVWASICPAICNVGMDKMKVAIQNYKAYIDEADQYTPNTDWTLAEFCFNTRYSDFLTGVKKVNRFKSNDPWDKIREEFQPLTSVYTTIFDDKNQRYYGFQLAKINSTIRWEDIASKIKCSNKMWLFNDFMELEWMIAGMLWRRKNEPTYLEVCINYMDKWKELIPNFKQKAKKWLKEDWDLYG